MLCFLKKSGTYLILFFVPIFALASELQNDAQNIVDQINQNVEQNVDYKKHLDFGETLNNKSFNPKIKASNGVLATNKGVNIDELLNRYSDKFNQAKEQRQKQLYQLMVFVSFSMPENSLKDWAKSVKDVGGVLVLRGMVDNSFTKTATIVNRLNQEGVAAIIDPTLYQKFNIQIVPSIVLLPKGYLNCKGESCDSITPNHDRIAGDITLDYALEQIKDNGDQSQDIAQIYLSRLRGEE